MYKNEECWNNVEFKWTKTSRKKFGKLIYLLNSVEESLESYPKSLLDVGCGDALSHQLLKKYKITGIDFTSNLIERAKQKNPNNTYLVHDACKPFPFKETFDIVISKEVLEHVPSPSIVLQNIYNVLKPGGYLLFSTPNAIKYEFFYTLFNRDWDWKSNKVPPLMKTVHQFLTPNCLCAMLKDIGFKIEYKSSAFKHIYILARKK